MELLKKSKKTQNQKKQINVRKLTNNERVLITLLAIVVLFWLGFKYVLEPQMLEIQAIESQINDYSLKIEDNNRKLNNWDAIVEERNSLQVEKETIEDDFFKSLSQPEIIVVLNTLLTKSQVVMESISFSKPVTDILNEQEIQKMDISIPFKGTYKAFNETIKEIEKETRKMIISSLSINKSEDTEIVGDINLGVYSLSGLVAEEASDIMIGITNDNKANPFIPFTGYTNPNNVNSTNEESMRQNSGGPIAPDTGIVSPGPGANEPEDQSLAKSEYEIYKAVRGDNISLISRREYGNESYVNEILRLNGMKRSSILPIGKELKLIKK